MRTIDLSKAVTTAINPPVILMPSMGGGSMPDFDALKQSLENIGAEVYSPDISEKGSMRHIPWDRVNVIDLSNMRGCLTSFDKYEGILHRLHDHMEQAENDGNPITIFPEYDDIFWIASKTAYLEHLIEQGVPTLPTKSLSRQTDPENASIITQPDNLEGMFSDIKEFIDASDKNRFVLKPSTSSLGRNLFFIDQNEDGSFTRSYPQESGTMQRVDYTGFDDMCNAWLNDYFTQSQSFDHHFILQEFVPNLETSVIFINGTPHFVERTVGEGTDIAHAKYGGTDTIIDNPEPELVKFAYEVLQALPESVQNSPFLRVDVMKNLETDDYILGEIEGAGAARLWLTEANRLDDYAEMLYELATGTKPPANLTANLEIEDKAEHG